MPSYLLYGQSILFAIYVALVLHNVAIKLPTEASCVGLVLASLRKPIPSFNIYRLQVETMSATFDRLFLDHELVG